MKTITLKTETVQAVMNYLYGQPYANVAGLIQSIQMQVQEQQKPELVKPKQDEAVNE